MCVLGSAGFEPQNEFKVCETSDNRSSKVNFWSILASGDCPAPLTTLAWMKGTDTLASVFNASWHLLASSFVNMNGAFSYLD